MKRDNYLNDIALIRLLLIVLLVAYHALAPYTGAWPSISGEGNILFKYLGEMCYSSMLPAFVFISGVLVGHQILLHGNPSTDFLKKKFKRLIIPSIVFSIVFYVFLIGKPTSMFFFYKIANGIWHLWFLPMLFWCFVMLYAVITLCDIDRYKYIILIASVILSIVYFVTLPLRLGEALYYFNFFYVGFLFGLRKLKFEIGLAHCIILWIFFFWIIYVFQGIYRPKNC